MSTPEPSPGPSMAMTPLEYLKQADKEIAAGNGRGAAGLLCKAIEGAIVRLAFNRGIEGANLYELAKALDRKSTAESHHYRGYVAHISTLRLHSEEEVLEDYELEGYRLGTRQLLVSGDVNSE